MKNPFRNIKKLRSDEIIDQSFNSASKSVKKERFEGTMLEKAKQKEGMRIKIVGNMAYNSLKAVAKSYPEFESIPEIYSELVSVVFNIDKLKRFVAYINWAANQIKKMQMNYLDKMSKMRHSRLARDTRKEFYGRVASFLKKAEKQTAELEGAYDILRKFPDVEDCPTVIIAGFPNVGKSSLLRELTGSAPEIKPYPFTTKGLMVGYSYYGLKKVQFFDTPGLLDRLAERRNYIEMQAIVALKILADLIVYVFDVSEICGYTLEEQKNLYKEIEKLFKKPMIAVANKIDVEGGRDISEIGIKNIIPISCEDKKGIESLKKKIKDIIFKG